MKYLTPKDIAEKTGTSAETVARWIRTGQLAATLVSSSTSTTRPRYRVRQDDLEVFLSGRQVKVATQGNSPFDPIQIFV